MNIQKTLETNENSDSKSSETSLNNEIPENSLQIRKLPSFFLENFISFCFPCGQQNFPRKGNLESASNCDTSKADFDDASCMEFAMSLTFTLLS